MKQQPSTQAVKKLPKEIAQLVDKGNFVIAINTLAERKGLSLEQAKAEIDTYEAWRKHKQTEQPKNNFDQLTRSVESSLEANGIKKALPRWVKLLLVLFGIGIMVAISFYYLNS